MDKKIIKTHLLQAMKDVHTEYQEDAHVLSMMTCPMCVLYRDNKNYDCTVCPMAQAFERCGSRNCTPMGCNTTAKEKKYKHYQRRLKAVTLFYERAMQEVRKRSALELQDSNFGFLREIDRDAYDEIWKGKV